jgi:hypothetical protein
MIRDAAFFSYRYWTTPADESVGGLIIEAQPRDSS